MNKPQKILLNAAGTVDLPPELVGAVPRLTLQGNSLLSVENHGGIKSYASDSILLHTALGTLEVSGKELTIRMMNREKMIIGGTILSAAYQETEDAEGR